MLDDKIKIKINVAGRLYPLTITPKEEESVRKAGKELNEMIKNFEQNYAINDKQDVLSMCALMLASKLELGQYKSNENDEESIKKIHHLIGLFDNAIINTTE